MKKSIIIFYTWSGNTRKLAEIIANYTGADLLEIEPVVPYSSHHGTVVKQAKEEIKKGYLPELKSIECDLSQYDIVYLGTPIWWGTMAPPLTTFLSDHDFNGKIIMPFCTYGGKPKHCYDRDIEKLCTDAIIKPLFITFKDGGKDADRNIKAWIEMNLNGIARLV